MAACNQSSDWLATKWKGKGARMQLNDQLNSRIKRKRQGRLLVIDHLINWLQNEKKRGQGHSQTAD